MALLNVPITNTTLKRKLEEHPNFPSLYSISQVMAKINVANQALAVDTDDFIQFKPPFIAYTLNGQKGKDFVLVSEVTEEFVYFIDEGSKPKQLEKTNFIKLWQKIVLVAEPGVQSGEKDYKSALKKEHKRATKNVWQFSGIAVLLILLFYTCLSKYTTVNESLFTAISIILLKVLGLTSAIFLLVYEIDKTNAFVKNICTAGGHTNCDAVLKSPAAKWMGLSWSEAGFFYFSATLLFLLTSSVSSTNFLLVLS
jgi:ABC-type bacteriocin/lantibiotic exporter with double-glycine peptidase domain